MNGKVDLPELITFETGSSSYLRAKEVNFSSRLLWEKTEIKDLPKLSTFTTQSQSFWYTNHLSLQSGAYIYLNY